LSLNFDEDEDWRLVMISVTSDFNELNGKKLIGLNQDELMAQLDKMKLEDTNIEDFESEEGAENTMIEIESISFNF